MRTNLTGRFLATLAVSATSVGATEALAAGSVETDAAAIDSRITLAFEGGLLQSDFDADKLGSFNEFGSDKLGDHDDDLYGAISLTRHISPDLDWRLSGAYHVGSERSANSGFSDGPFGFDFDSEDDFDFQTIDFDIGKHFQSGNNHIRLFGGLRALHVSENLDSNFAFSIPVDPKGGNLDKVGSSEFYGVGPRIGAEIYHAMTPTWGLSGSVAGAAIWGRRETDFDGTLVLEGGPPEEESFDEDSSEMITNLELKAGITWMPWQNTAFTAGYRIDRWSDLLTGFDGLTGGDEGQTFHGPFLKLEVKM